MPVLSLFSVLGCRDDAMSMEHSHFVAKDSSGHGNDLPLVSVPMQHDAVISKVISRLFSMTTLLSRMPGCLCRRAFFHFCDVAS